MSDESANDLFFDDLDPIDLEAAPEAEEAEDGRIIITRTREGMEAALKHLSVLFRRNTRSGQVEVIYRTPDWKELSDDTEDKIRTEIENNCGFASTRGKEIGEDKQKCSPAVFGDTVWKRYLGAILYDNQVDPFKDYLEELPPWDGIDRLDQMFHTCIMAEDTALNSAAGRAWLVAAVARTYEPGRKHDWIPVLIGAQGCGKSTFAKTLTVRPRDWFSEEADLSLSGKENCENIGSAVLVEFPELVGIPEWQLSKIKAFLSRSTDRHRAAYAHRPTPSRGAG